MSYGMQDDRYPQGGAPPGDQRINGPSAAMPQPPAPPEDYRAAYQAQQGGWGANPPQDTGVQQGGQSGPVGVAPHSNAFAGAAPPIPQGPYGHLHPDLQSLIHRYATNLPGYTPPPVAAPPGPYQAGPRPYPGAGGGVLPAAVPTPQITPSPGVLPPQIQSGPQSAMPPLALPPRRF